MSLWSANRPFGHARFAIPRGHSDVGPGLLGRSLLLVASVGLFQVRQSWRIWVLAEVDVQPVVRRRKPVS